jgi:RNA polymerase sigma factor (sigma-70 family)
VRLAASPDIGSQARAVGGRSGAGPAPLGAAVTVREASEHGFATILAAARSGQPDAWSDLYHEVAPLVLGYLRSQRLTDAEDVAGEVLLHVVRDLPRFQGDHRGFRAWVLAIAHHRLLDARRRSARHPATTVPTADLDERPAPEDAEAATLAAFGLADLQPALASLTDDQRAVLLLRVVADLAVADVADVLGKRPGAVKQLQRRALESMRRSLSPPAAIPGTN